MCALPQDTPTLGFFETLYPPKKRLKKKMFSEKIWDALCILQINNLLTRNSPKSYLINIKKN